MAETTEKAKRPAMAQVKISDVVLSTLRHWPWIIVSVAICVGAAWFYLMRTSPVYTRTASIMIKNDSAGKSAGGNLDAFANMGLIQTNTNIADEVNKLNSPDMMEEVARRLHLDINYTTDGHYHDQILYGPTLPVNVSFPALPENETASLKATINKEGQVTLSNLIVNGKELTLPANGRTAFGDTIATAAGAVVINKTPYYQPSTAYEINVTKVPMLSAAAAYAGKVAITMKNDKSNAINLTATDYSTQRAEDLINTLIDVYNEQWMTNRNQIARSTSSFIDERLRMIEHELGNVDQDISSYQSQNLIPDVQQAASMYMSENQATSARLLDLGTQLQMTRYMRAYITSEANRNQLIPANSGIGSASIESEIAAYNTNLLQRNQYAANSSETHPLVTDLDSQIASMRASIIKSVDNQIKALETQINNLRANQSHTTARIAANPTQAKYLLSVERQQKVKESLYLFLLQKREENELSQAFTPYNTEIITSPHGSNAPTAPQRSKILLCAFAIGLAIPFGVSYLLETNNTRIRGRKDLEDLPIPFLGEIPLSSSSKSSKKNIQDKTPQIVVQHGKRNIINEAFRVLRTNLGFMTATDTPCSVIMVTSFNPGSGKTFLTMNIAVSLAIKGKKVLVIDGDMRRSSTSAYVNTPVKGLSNYLVGNIDDIKSIIIPNTIQAGLSVLPVGTIPPNPTELLETERFTKLIATLRNHYDYIFIDCPPIEMMADAQIIETVVDRTIFVVRSGLLERAMLPELERIYNDKRYRNLSLILNATPTAASRYGYGYYYGNYSHYTKE